MSNASLTLVFDPGFGRKRLSMAIGLDEHTAALVRRVAPPSIDACLPMLSDPFEAVVEKLHARAFRKDLFIQECVRLGTLLAERMEDAEGWHDESRIEPAKKELAHD